MGRMSREKGKRGELEAAHLLRAHGFAGYRGQQERGGPDSPDVAGLPGWHIEVKRTESFRLWDAMAQATRDCGDKAPVVLHRPNRHPWVAVMWADDFLDWVRSCQKGGYGQEEEER